MAVCLPAPGRGASGPAGRIPSMIAESMREAAGQVLVAGFPGRAAPAELTAAATRGELGGFVLFKRNLGGAEEVAELTRSLAAACPSDAPPFVAVDQEGGRVQRLGPPILQLPPMRVLGAIDDPALTEALAELLGAQLAALGFNLDFAPVLDVDSNPDNPVIGDRAFGRDPELVARHAAAFARGLERGGVLACAKHFPGHGDTALDSHLALPTVAHDRARLSSVELRPFELAARAASTLMTAHIVFPAYDPVRPATLSRALVHALLRGSLGYRGVVFSDDLEMKAISDHYGVGEAACLAIEAGCDALLVCSRPELCFEAHAALCGRAEADARFAARLHEAAERGLSARRRRPPRALDTAALTARLVTLASAELQDRLARARAAAHA
jgi:beta-N-acetylhexosaminidase